VYAVRSGLRHPRLDLNQFAALPGDALAHLAVSDALSHGRIPGAEEIRAERNHIARSRQVERRKLLEPETSRVGAAQDLVAEHVKLDRIWRAEAAQELRHERVFLPAQRASQESERPYR
jgi:hypothetical protein